MSESPELIARARAHAKVLRAAGLERKWTDRNGEVCMVSTTATGDFVDHLAERLEEVEKMLASTREELHAANKERNELREECHFLLEGNTVLMNRIADSEDR